MTQVQSRIGLPRSTVLTDPVWVRAAAKSLTVVALVAALLRVTAMTSPWSGLLLFAGVFLLPAGVFRESYGWSAGFFNYVPPMVGVVLLVGTIAGRWPSRRVGGVCCALLCTLLGFVTCLFVEHVTVAVLSLALGGVLVMLARRTVVGPELAGWAAGALAGTVVLFSSPGLTAVVEHEDAYFSYPATAAGMAAMAITNYAVITTAFGFSIPVVMLLMGGGVPLAVHAANQGSFGRMDWILMVGGPVLAVYALVTRLLVPERFRCVGGVIEACHLGWLTLDLVALLLLLGLVVLAGVRLVRPGPDMAAWVGLLAATLLMLGPLLVVSPIGPRNLVGPTITLVALLALTVRPLLELHCRVPCLPARAGVAVTTAVGLGWLTVVSVANAQVADERVRLMEEAVTAREARVELPRFPWPK